MSIIRNIFILYRKFKLPIANCRYYPTCSGYAEEAIEKYGVKKGIILGIKRILRCNQFFPGGFDPVP